MSLDVQYLSLILPFFVVFVVCNTVHVLPAYPASVLYSVDFFITLNTNIRENE